MRRGLLLIALIGVLMMSAMPMSAACCKCIGGGGICAATVQCTSDVALAGPGGLFDQLCTDAGCLSGANCQLGGTCGVDTFGDCAPTGQCLLEDGCSELSQGLCEELGGTYAGDGTTCARAHAPAMSTGMMAAMAAALLAGGFLFVSRRRTAP